MGERSGVREFVGGADAGDELAAFFGENAEIAFDLKPMPETLGLAEEGAEADGHGRGDGPAPQNDFVDGAGRHSDGAGHGVLGDSHGLEIFLQQDLSGCNGRVHGYNV